MRCAWSIAAVALALAASAQAQGIESAGNVDGALTWDLGPVEPKGQARAVVLLAFDGSYEKLRDRLAAARREFATLPPAPAPPAQVKPAPDRAAAAWIANDATDFALQPDGRFNWELGQRQALCGPKGGQLSQFGWCIHYGYGSPGGGAGVRRVGAPSVGQAGADAPRVVAPVRAMSKTQAAGAFESPDGAVGVHLRAVMGRGSEVAIELILTNQGRQRLSDLRLSIYANLEADHDHDNDYATLDGRTESWLAVDAASGVCAALAGLTRPESGWSAIYRQSEGRMLAGTGVPRGEWPESPGLSGKAALARKLARRSIPNPIAPEVDPVTPPTRTLTPQEAAAVLEDDWLFQTGNRPTLQRIADEIGWTRELAERISRPGSTTLQSCAPDLKEELGELNRLGQEAGLIEQSAGATPAAAVLDLYLAVRRVKRRIMFKNPIIDFTQVLFIDNPYPQGGEWPHQARHRNGYMAVPGGRLLVLDGLHPGGKVRQLAPDRPGSFWRPDLSFDARRVVFCFKPHDEKAFHLYEVNIDGTRLRQLTFGDYDDLDPIYLPDVPDVPDGDAPGNAPGGHIMFCTGRANTYVRCMPYTQSYILARCDADGRNTYIISHNNEPDWVPSLLNDGRVVYSRWEYTDKALWRIQSLWTTNPDGTGTATFWGNQSVWPDHLAEPRAIPGSRRVMFAAVGHHDWFSGCIGIIDQDKGLNFPDGITKVTADLLWPEVGNGPVNPIESPRYHRSGGYDSYKTPYPLSEVSYLASARRGGKFRLYLMDVHGNRELVYEGMHNIWHAVPVRPRPRPPAIPDRVAWPGTGKDRKPPEMGALFSPDVCQGVPDLPRDRVKYLRIITLDAKTYSDWNKTYRHSGPAVSIVQEDGVKRFLGTVPVRADGSVYFRAPPGKALHFQLLDERFRALHTMRSFTGVMPGENRGCLGCHELHSAAPQTGTAPISISRDEPDMITPPPWGDETIGYERFVQPVLDRYCGRCHQGDGPGRKKLDLTLRPAHGPFKEPYLTLIGPVWTSPVRPGAPGAGVAGCLNVEGFSMTDPRSYATVRPMTTLSYRSHLVDIASSGKHNGVKVDELSLLRLMAWIDATCPFRGEPEIRALGDPDLPGIDLLPIRPRVRTAPVVNRP